MIKITKESLMWAYGKLKNYVYYASPASYLKDKIIEFEKGFDNNSFEKMAIELNKLLSNNYDVVKNKNISYTVYPKKDGICDDNNEIIVEKYNLFIDMPLKFFLLDVLFTLELFDRMDVGISDFSFGNDFNNVLWDIKNNKRDGSVLKNKYLFANFNTQYENWKGKIYGYIEENSQNDYYILKMDFKRSYYNVYFDFDGFVSNFLGKDFFNDPIYKFELHLYRYYSGILNNHITDVTFNKKGNYVHLPIGLFSSACIFNILLEEFDNYMIKNTEVYSRYVDDMLVVLQKNNKGIKNDISEILNEYFPDKFVLKDGEFSVNGFLEDKGHYIINKDKIKVITYKKGFNIGKVKRQLNKIIKPSLDVVEEIDFEENTFEESDLYKHDYLKSVINNLEYSNTTEKLDFLKKVSDAELINIYSSWKKLLLYEGDYFKLRIENGINKIKTKSDDEILCKLKEALKKELDFAVNCDLYKEHLLCDISQDRVFEHIRKIQNNENDLFYPLNVTFDEITIFLSQNDKISKVDFINNATDLYKKANYLSIQSKCESIIDGKLIFFKSIEEAKHRNISVAVANLNLTQEELGKCDIEGYFPATYGLKDILHIIELAKNLNAEVIVFPELSIPECHTLEVVKFCRKVGISIVAGLTHKNNDGYLVNYTLIRDNDLDIALCKSKNYMPIDEKEFCIEHRLGFKESEEPFYLIFDNGNYKYSTMTCFEATNIQDRAILCDKINVLYMPVFNRDTFYFSNIISSFVRDASCFVAQANANCYGDSRISGPFGHVFIDVVKLKGGENNYFVLGEIDINKICEKNKLEEEIQKDFELNNYFGIDNIKEIQYKIKKFKELKPKPLSAGENRYKVRKENGLDKETDI